MKRLLLIFVSFILFSCNSGNIPDVSDISVPLKVQRFEQDFFSMDTSDVAGSLVDLRLKYPVFLPDYFHNILGIPLDSTLDNSGEIANAIRQFVRDYHPVRDSSDKIFKDFTRWEKQIQHGLQFVKYYFPDYRLPDNIITFIGPFDAFFATSFGVQGDVLTQDGLGIGLMLHLGKDFSFFKSEAGRELFPAYISETFAPEYIVIDCMHNIVDDLFPSPHLPSSLIEQMVSSGRKYYLLGKFLPRTDDNLVLGYTADQMKAVYKNEAVIWDFFQNNDILNSTDQSVIKNYVGPGPKTQEFGDGSPGNIGSFSGLQIVRKFMERFPETTLRQLMTMPPRQIYERSKYKPRS